MRMRQAVLACLFSGLCVAFVEAGEKLELADGERIVILGNTFVERDVQYGYIETALTLAYWDKNLTFRNLGWSGDTVWGHARAGFGSTQDGYNNLVKQVKDAKPTTLIVCYGLSESFDGESGLAPFIAQYTKMLDDVSSTQAKLVIVTPIRHEKLGGGLPDADAHNKKLELYVNALKDLAAKRNAVFADLFEVSQTKGGPYTDNGVHLSEKGYIRYSNCLIHILKNGKLPPQYSTFDATPNGPLIPLLRPKLNGPEPKAAELSLVEKLRQLIVEKNTLFFHRWRPQNDTYIFGFRKHEQGRNAVDIPKFDPLVEAKEKEIAALKASIK